LLEKTQYFIITISWCTANTLDMNIFNKQATTANKLDAIKFLQIRRREKALLAGNKNNNNTN